MLVQKVTQSIETTHNKMKVINSNFLFSLMQTCQKKKKLLYPKICVYIMKILKTLSFYSHLLYSLAWQLPSEAPKKLNDLSFLRSLAGLLN
jgi:hypothetical protein